MKKKTLLLMSAAVLLITATMGCKKSTEGLETQQETLPQMKTSGAGLVQTSWPTSADPGLPFYARIEPAPPHVYHNNEYAAIVFYREPSLIPADFNLLTMFDVPGAFSIPLNVSGTSLWTGQAGMGSPKMVNATGDAVHIWFVPVNALLSLIQQQNHLSMNTLASIPGVLYGMASQFVEINHPHPLPPQMGGGGHEVPKMVLHAKGTLAGGGSFDLNLNALETSAGWKRSTRIKLSF